MELYFTRHARNRMRLYDIGQEEVRAALEHAEEVTAGPFGRQHAWKREVHGQWLRVTFRDEPARRIVITVTPKQKFAGEANAH